MESPSSSSSVEHDEVQLSVKKEPKALFEKEMRKARVSNQQTQNYTLVLVSVS